MNPSYYVIVVEIPGQEAFVRKSASRKRRAIFKDKEAAVNEAMRLSKQHPRWKLTVKVDNGIDYDIKKVGDTVSSRIG